MNYISIAIEGITHSVRHNLTEGISLRDLKKLVRIPEDARIFKGFLPEGQSYGGHSSFAFPAEPLDPESILNLVDGDAFVTDGYLERSRLAKESEDRAMAGLKKIPR